MNVSVGAGVIDAYAGWVGTVGAKVQLSEKYLHPTHRGSSHDISHAFTRLAAVAGTSTCHLALSDKPVFVDGVWGPYRDVLIPEYWMAEGGQSATGELLKHVLETHPAFQEAFSAADAFNTNVYDYLNQYLAEMRDKETAPSISYLARHFFFYGDLFGNRSPLADPAMRGSIIGLSSDKSVDNLAIHYYSTMEFIALQTRQIVEQMNDAGHMISSIFMSGSQCQNEVLMDLIATACNMPVVIPRYVHAAVVHGAAMLGVKAASTSESLWNIMDRMSKPGKVVYPTDSDKERSLLAAKYRVFAEQYRKQKDYRAAVDSAIAGWKD